MDSWRRLSGSTTYSELKAGDLKFYTSLTNMFLFLSWELHLLGEIFPTGPVYESLLFIEPKLEVSFQDHLLENPSTSEWGLKLNNSYYGCWTLLLEIGYSYERLYNCWDCLTYHEGFTFTGLWGFFFQGRSST